MSQFSRLSSIVVLAAVLGSRCANVVIDLPIVNAEISPDGFTRGAVLAGGTFPGPLISGRKGDRFRINVQDELTDDTMLRGTSIHWHGFFQKGSNEMDGATWVTQCPIAPLSSFEYDFTGAGQTGTMWYHSHLSSQYCDGLRGAMVIYDPADPHASLYDVDDASTVITLADWYHTKAKVQTFPAAQSSTLINGLGRFGTTLSPLSVVSVTAGLRYRFRVVSLSCSTNWIFSIHGHTFSVIEADAEDTIPVSTSSVQIFAGQRYSIVMAADQEINNYWIRAAPNAGPDRTFVNGLNSAILRYVGAPEVEPTTLDPESVPLLLETDLHPLTKQAAPGSPTIGGVDYALNLALSSVGGLFLVNGVGFSPPSVPVLLQIMSGAAAAQDLLPAGSVYSLPLDSTIELSIPAAGAPGGPHPFHLHGHSFSVVRAAGSEVYNYVDPVRRDVVSMGAGTDNVTIRFTTDNAGPWFLHCHIDWHLEEGLAVVFAEGMREAAIQNPTSAAWDNLCPAWNSLSPEDL